ncbi:MAG: LssY C-terminal domain-containing protein [Elusimicrobiota bacterium]
MVRTICALSLILLETGALCAQEPPSLNSSFNSAREALSGRAIDGIPAPATPAAMSNDAVSTVSPELEAILRTLPSTDIGHKGHAGYPLSLVFIGTKSQIAGALKQASWTSVPRRLPVSFIEGLGQLIRGKKPTVFPPFHSYVVDGKKQDANWAHVVTSIKSRHHFRLWRLNVRDPQGREIWWGSASLDTGIRWKFIVPVTHNTDPDLAAEQDYVAQTLQNSPFIQGFTFVDLPQIPRGGWNDQREQFTTKGRALVVEFGAPPQAQADDRKDDSITFDPGDGKP